MINPRGQQFGLMMTQQINPSKSDNLEEVIIRELAEADDLET